MQRKAPLPPAQSAKPSSLSSSGSSPTESPITSRFPPSSVPSTARSNSTTTTINNASPKLPSNPATPPLSLSSFNNLKQNNANEKPSSSGTSPNSTLRNGPMPIQPQKTNAVPLKSSFPPPNNIATSNATNYMNQPPPSYPPPRAGVSNNNNNTNNNNNNNINNHNNNIPNNRPTISVTRPPAATNRATPTTATPTTPTPITPNTYSGYPALNRQNKPARPPRPRLKVIKAYNALDDQELSLNVGDILVLRERDKNFWGRGTKENSMKEGWFPLECVESLDPNFHLPKTPEEKKLSRVDTSSLVQNRAELSDRLSRRITVRPTRQELIEHNILPASTVTETSPLLQEASVKLEKNKKGDFISNLLKKRGVGADEKSLLMSTSEISFGNQEVDIETKVTDTFVLTSYNKTKFSVEYQTNSANSPTEMFQAIPPSIQLSFEPAKGILAKNKPQLVKVNMTIKTFTPLTEVTVYIHEGEKTITKYPLKLKINCKKGIFGAEPRTLTLAVDPDNGLEVPELLIQLKSSLKNLNAFSKEGIFRISGEASVVASLKKKYNNKESVQCTDAFAIANLLKVWFRELPNPLLQCISKDDLYSEDPETCMKAMYGLPQFELELLKWLMHIIDECSSNREVNKMSVENLVIVIAPNLYRMGPEIDAVEGLVRTQKLAKFFQTIVEGFIQQKKTKSRPSSQNATPNSSFFKDPVASSRLPSIANFGIKSNTLGSSGNNNNNTGMTPGKLSAIPPSFQKSDPLRRRSQSTNSLLTSEKKVAPPLPNSPKPAVRPRPIGSLGKKEFTDQFDAAK